MLKLHAYIYVKTEPRHFLCPFFSMLFLHPHPTPTPRYIWCYPQAICYRNVMIRRCRQRFAERNAMKNPSFGFLSKPEMLEQKQALNPELQHHKPCLTRCWAPKPKGVLFVLWRLEKSTHAGHGGNMMGQEGSNPRRGTVELSVRHTPPPLPFRELNISLCQNKWGDPQIFFLFPDFNLMSAGNEKDREGVWRDSSVHMKAPWRTTQLNTDTGNSYNLIVELVVIPAATRFTTVAMDYFSLSETSNKYLQKYRHSQSKAINVDTSF